MAGPLTTALKPSMGADEDTEAKYQEALAELMQRLDGRKNRLFDPTLLAMAQGFLAPTQTGGFGEALGRAAEKVGVAQSQQQKEDLDLAQLRLQVAQGAREQAAQMQGQKAFRGLLGGAGGSGGAGGAGGAGAPAGAPAAEPAGAPAGAPTQGRPLTMEQALAFRAAYPNQSKLADALVEAVKFNSDRYKIAMNGTVFDTVTGEYVGQIPPGQTASDFFVPEARGTVKMTPGQYDAYQKARATGKGKEWVDKFFETEPGKTPEYLTQELIAQRAEERKQTASEYFIPELQGTLKMTPAQYNKYEEAKNKGVAKQWLQDFTSGKPMTSGELAAREAGKKTAAEAAAKSEEERYSATIAKGEDARGRIANYGMIEATAKQPGADQIFGVFENGKFSDALFRLLETNKGVVSVPEIREIWTNLGLDPKLIADKQFALSLIAQSQFAFSSLAKGQGAISDFERQLFNAMGTSLADRPEAVVKKMQMLRQMAEWDRTVSRLAKKGRKDGVAYDDMKDSEEYDRAYQSHVKKLMDIVTSAGVQIPQSAAPAAPRTAAPAAPATPRASAPAAPPAPPAPSAAPPAARAAPAAPPAPNASAPARPASGPARPASRPANPSANALRERMGIQ
jgi:hypothetical protein